MEKKDKIYEEYYDNGQLWVKATYKDGKKEGLWEYYLEDGQLKFKRTYKGGCLINSYMLDSSDGTLIEKEYTN